MESLPATALSALLDRASATELWILDIWLNWMSENLEASFLVSCFQPSRWTELSLLTWLIQSMISLESPKTWRWFKDQKLASERETHRPRSSALLLVPAPQLRNQFVVLDWWALKEPPAPQQRPLERAAPSKLTRTVPSVQWMLQTLFGNTFWEVGCQLKLVRILWRTDWQEGGLPSKIARFLSTSKLWLPGR